MKRLFAISFFVLAELLGGLEPAYANNLPPTSVITTNPNRIWFYAGEQVVFSGLNSYDNDEHGYAIAAYSWTVYIDDEIESVPAGTSTSQPTITLCFDDKVAIGSVSNGCMGTGGKQVELRLRVTDDEGSQSFGYTGLLTVKQQYVRTYYLKDHLGSIRTTVDADGNVLGYDDY